jgi:hypothetical protein
MGTSYIISEEEVLVTTAGKAMLTVFWDLHRLILEHYVERGLTVNTAHWCDMLWDNLKPAIHGNCQNYF